MTTVSVIIPSRLAKAPDGELWAQKAVNSIRRQESIPDGFDIKPIVALDAKTARPSIDGCHIHVCQSGPPGHVHAMNEAMSQFLHEKPLAGYVAFLEDDDQWNPKRLAYGLKVIQTGQADFVSCTQMEYKADQPQLARFNDFPTCSGWLAPAALFKHFMPIIGNPFHERFRIHWDNEFLGRLNQATIFRRAHLVEKGADPTKRPWLQAVAKYAKLIEVPESEPLVRRSVHGDSVMGQVEMDAKRKERSNMEYAACNVLYDCIPW